MNDVAHHGSGTAREEQPATLLRAVVVEHAAVDLQVALGVDAAAELG